MLDDDADEDAIPWGSIKSPQQHMWITATIVESVIYIIIAVILALNSILPWSVFMLYKGRISQRRKSFASQRL